MMLPHPQPTWLMLVRMRRAQGGREDGWGRDRGSRHGCSGASSSGYPSPFHLHPARRSLSPTGSLLGKGNIKMKYPWVSPEPWFSSVSQPCPTLCDPMDCSTPGLPIHHQLPESSQTHVHCVGEAIQPSHPLSSPSPPAFSLSQHQGLFQWISSSYQVANVLELQLQHPSFQWIFRTDFL